MKNIIISILLSITIISCSKNEIVKDDSIIDYVNYKETDIKVGFSKPIYKKGEDISFYYILPYNVKFTINSFEGKAIDVKNEGELTVQNNKTNIKNIRIVDPNSKKFDYSTNVIDNDDLESIFSNLRKEDVANSLKLFHINKGDKEFGWVPKSLKSNYPNNRYPGEWYNYMKGLNFNILDGVYGMYEYYFTQDKLDSIIVTHENAGSMVVGVNCDDILKSYPGEILKRNLYEGYQKISYKGFILTSFMDEKRYSKTVIKRL